MTVKIVIARHGNTFETEEVGRRIGARTDLPLTEAGKNQAIKMGAYLKENGLLPDIVFTSRLKRTIETAEIAVKEAGLKRAIQEMDLFDEIDYGPDENKIEAEVANRLGAHAYNAWETQNLMPREWSPQPDVIRKRWYDFAKYCEETFPDHTILVVTSNGIARFAPLLANNAQDMVAEDNRKMKTGSLSIFEGDGGMWMISHWNIKP